MPIYEYRCSSCGHKLETLQKFSDPPMTTCPSCNADAMVKQVSAAGFQLKGSGWYATDFKGSGAKPAAPKDGADSKPEAKGVATGETASESKSESKGEARSDSKGEAKSDGKSDAKSETKGSSPAPASGTGAPPAST